MAYFDSITQLVGGTPLVGLPKINKTVKGEVLLKLESFNPMSSVKDRIGLAMVEEAEKKGLLKEGSVIVEATSGNTGIALAFVGAAKGYRVILTMPDTMSMERRKLLKALGAELELTPGSGGMKAAVDRAVELVENTKGAFMPSQFKNPANPNIHYRTTAEEIWADTKGKVDVLVAGVGTGGTLTGVGRKLREKNPDIKVVAVEPEESPVISGGAPGSHKIQGIGAGFIPDNLDTSLIDEVIKIKSAEAGETSRRLAREEGILLGISAGANVQAALQIADRPENTGKTIVTIGCDTGERYLSTWLFDE